MAVPLVEESPDGILLTRPFREKEEAHSPEVWTAQEAPPVPVAEAPVASEACLLAPSAAFAAAYKPRLPEAAILYVVRAAVGGPADGGYLCVETVNEAKAGAVGGAKIGFCAEGP